MGRQLTDGSKVTDVHATIKLEGSTEGVERDEGGQGEKGTVFLFTFTLHSNWV